MKAMENHPCEKFPQENYNGEDILHSNRRCSELSMALEEEQDIIKTYPVILLLSLNKINSYLSVFNCSDFSDFFLLTTLV